MPSKIMPTSITYETGMILISGLLVLMEGMYYSIPFTMKNILIALFNCMNNVIGKKFHLLYFLELTLLSGYRLADDDLESIQISISLILFQISQVYL